MTKEYLHIVKVRLEDWNNMIEHNQELLTLVDGCFEIVENFKPESVSLIEWKRVWLENARKFGASGE